VTLNEMGVNKNRPHVFVLPEDDANRQIAAGFTLGVPMESSRQIYVLPVAGGWMFVLDKFLSDERVDMENCPARHMVLLIDFDNDEERLRLAIDKIPESVRERVFVLGALSEPEDLRADLGSYEKIGLALATDWSEDTTITWDHHLLRHNANELARLRLSVRPFLF
jgi:hypothetical protein